MLQWRVRGWACASVCEYFLRAECVFSPQENRKIISGDLITSADIFQPTKRLQCFLWEIKAPLLANDFPLLCQFKELIVRDNTVDGWIAPVTGSNPEFAGSHRVYNSQSKNIHIKADWRVNCPLVWEWMVCVTRVYSLPSSSIRLLSYKRNKMMDGSKHVV